MECSVELPATISPNSDQDLWIRYLAGHRRVSEVYLESVAEYCADSFDFDAPWLERLLGKAAIPFFGGRYTVVDAGGDVPGTKYWVLTLEGLAAIDAWIERRDYWAPINGKTGVEKLVLLLLWGSGCGVPQGHWARKPYERRKAIDTFIPGGGKSGRLFVKQNVTSIQTRDLFEAINKLQSRDEGWSLGAPVEPVDMRQAVTIFRWIAEHPSQPGIEYLVKATRRGRSREGLGRFGVLETPGWTLLRKAARSNITGVPERSRIFAEINGSRSVNTQSKAPALPLTDASRNQLAGIKRTQILIGQVLQSHPGAVAMTATLWPLNDFMVYRDDHTRAGQPSALDMVSRQRGEHPMLRKTSRIPDGVLWVPGDREEEPSIWIEYEGGPSHLRTDHHIAAALAMSSRWGKKLTVIVGTAKEAEEPVVSQVRRFLTEELLEKQAADWPGAQVLLRVVRYDPSREECILHGTAVLEHSFVSPGETLREARR